MSSYTVSLADPSGSNVLISAVAWLQGTMLGTVATSVAVVAVAAVGALMLSGRIDWRRGATVIAGCFVLFGATSIVAGLQGVAENAVAGPYVPVDSPPPMPLRSPVPATVYDPYAGASVRS
jgi:type IV secretory pathway VirB2 component (pilin)